MTKIANVDQTVEPVDSLTPHPRNPNQGDVGSISESIEAHGFYGQVIAQQSTRTILAGEHRWRAAKAAGMAEIPVTWVDVDDDQALRIVLVDNRSAELAFRDPQGLVDLLQELAQTPLALAGTGYDGDALDELLADLAPPKVQGEDVVGAPPEKPITKPGDLWELGPHRLLCGDSTKRETYRSLLGDERPELLLTDPPYGVSHGSGITDAKAIRGDIGQAVIPISFACALEVLDANARLYVFAGSEQFGMYQGLWDHHLHDFPRVIVWVKEAFVLRQIGYHSQFELCYWGWKGKGGGSTYWSGDRKQSDVWQFAREGADEREHPTQKPVEMFQVPIGNSSPPGGVVLEPFGGSGTTLIAAENLGRAARLIELDPGYCDVICKRYQGVSGIVPVRDGKPHDFLAGTR